MAPNQSAAADLIMGSSRSGPSSYTGFNITGIAAEREHLWELYWKALGAGGQLVIYVGEECVTKDLNEMKEQFEGAFPGIRIHFFIDASKLHNLRISHQLAINTVVFDIALIQQLHDYTEWKEQGLLLDYKPIGWDKVYPEFKDPDGAFTGIYICANGLNINRQTPWSNSLRPGSALDYLNPEFKNKLIVSHPNDNYAVLFWMKRVTDKYGLEYLEKFQAQRLTFARGSTECLAKVRDGTHLAPISAFNGRLGDQMSPVKFRVTKDLPLVFWAQPAAIFKKSPHPDAAKLFINWLLALGNQDGGWSVRSDAAPPQLPFLPIRDYDLNNQQAFLKFLQDFEGDSESKEIKLFMDKVCSVFGGFGSSRRLGLYPGKTLTDLHK